MGEGLDQAAVSGYDDSSLNSDLAASNSTAEVVRSDLGSRALAQACSDIQEGLETNDDWHDSMRVRVAKADESRQRVRDKGNAELRKSGISGEINHGFPYGQSGAMFVSAAGEFLVARVHVVGQEVPDSALSLQTAANSAALQTWHQDQGVMSELDVASTRRAQEPGQPLTGHHTIADQGVHIQLPPPGHLEENIAAWRQRPRLDQADREQALVQTVAVVTRPGPNGTTRQDVFYPVDAVLPEGGLQSRDARAYEAYHRDQVLRDRRDVPVQLVPTRSAADGAASSSGGGQAAEVLPLFGRDRSGPQAGPQSEALPRADVPVSNAQTVAREAPSGQVIAFPARKQSTLKKLAGTIRRWTGG
ncbi:MAG TPA: hypothetical protein VMB52_02430 [Verrucomicrobiae bacterium]|nr:hypothetical protein [Verrucomicrobiae bacterium]